MGHAAALTTRLSRRARGRPTGLPTGPRVSTGGSPPDPAAQDRRPGRRRAWCTASETAVALRQTTCRTKTRRGTPSRIVRPVRSSSTATTGRSTARRRCWPPEGDHAAGRPRLMTAEALGRPAAARITIPVQPAHGDRPLRPVRGAAQQLRPTVAARRRRDPRRRPRSRQPYGTAARRGRATSVAPRPPRVQSRTANGSWSAGSASTAPVPTGRAPPVRTAVRTSAERQAVRDPAPAGVDRDALRVPAVVRERVEHQPAAVRSELLELGASAVLHEQHRPRTARLHARCTRTPSPSGTYAARTRTNGTRRSPRARLAGRASPAHGRPE